MEKMGLNCWRVWQALLGCTCTNSNLSLVPFRWGFSVVPSLSALFSFFVQSCVRKGNRDRDGHQQTGSAQLPTRFGRPSRPLRAPGQHSASRPQLVSSRAPVASSSLPLLCCRSVSRRASRAKWSSSSGWPRPSSPLSPGGPWQMGDGRSEVGRGQRWGEGWGLEQGWQ